MLKVLGTVLLGAVLALSPSAAHAAIVALWHMDEPPGATTMVDSAGTGGVNNGTIYNVLTGEPALVDGTGYRFGGATSYVQVPDNGSLDPHSARMTITATVRADNKTMPDDSYDLVRKGVTTTAGGFWKMEIKRASDPNVGKLLCVFKGLMADGSRVAVRRIANVDLIDGNKHRLQCIKTPTSVQAVVDGRTFTTSRVTGSIDNDQAVVVGAKTMSDDVLQGVLDEVSIDIG